MRVASPCGVPSTTYSLHAAPPVSRAPDGVAARWLGDGPDGHPGHRCDELRDRD